MPEAAFLTPEISLAETIKTVFGQQEKHQYAIADTTVRQRVEKLERLGACVLKYRQEIYDALWADFRKPPAEVDVSEIGVVMGEIRHTVKHLASWMQPKPVQMILPLLGTRSEIRYRPKGVCLVISPWNFPLNLTFSPLVSAIAAGNCVMLKPSEMTPHCSALMGRIVAECFPPEEVFLVEGDAQVAQTLLQLPFNHIFFTGSPAIGKHIMRAAAEHLSSVTLELGGKSPVIVDGTSNLMDTAGQIMWLNCLNTGQICIAPDYVLVQKDARDALVDLMVAQVKKFYGDTPQARQQSADYPRMVNDRHFQRVKNLLDDALAKGARLAFGGHTDAAERYIEPSILLDVPEDALIWEEEIFGPLLPIRTFEALEETLEYLHARPRPLSLYIHSHRKKNIEYLLTHIRCGNVAVNDCGVQFYSQYLPFGGSNNSGIGETHGHFGFMAFTHQQSVVHQNRLFPHTRIFHPPYAKTLTRWMREGLVKWM
jgi:aldehyde dehydrogenase (NAD+)